MFKNTDEDSDFIPNSEFLTSLVQLFCNFAKYTFIPSLVVVSYKIYAVPRCYPRVFVKVVVSVSSFYVSCPSLVFVFTKS